MPMVQIHMLAGRSPEEKKKLLASVTEAVAESIGAPLASIRVFIHEFSDEDYMVAGHLAADRKKGAP